MMGGGKQARYKTVDTALNEASSYVNSGIVNPGNINDASDSTFVSYVSASGTIDTATMTLTFPAITDAQEIFSVRFRCKGQAGTGAGISAGVSLTSAADATALPSGGSFLIASYPTGGALNTMDTGLMTSNYFVFTGDLLSNIDCQDLIGSSAAVINWWKGGPRAILTLTDSTGAFTGGNIYTVSIQVRYRSKS